jgi:hypothetical protein
MLTTKDLQEREREIEIERESKECRNIRTMKCSRLTTVY